MNRRRFLCLTAAALALPGRRETLSEWQGTGLGTTLTLRLVGATEASARRLFHRVEAEITRIETLASLYRDSALTRLNRDGRLAWPGDDLAGLLGLAGQVHAATGGAFDPTVQPLWRALATGQDTTAAAALIGWHRVRVAPQEIRLAPGQQLTLNGIAQGWAADRIAALLRANGFANALVDMGETRSMGHRPDGADWQAQITDANGMPLASPRLTNRALATSSPQGTLIAGQPHILGPTGQPPLWQTASVSAPSAALADALSTAFCLMPRPAIDAALAAFPGARLEALA
ncbi:MAG: FAD:protein FMN transferase [Rhodobacter sp.]|jgi:thiamine biosynthesis lipoprotein|nr:FAD:protein FMN transferase [Rhodobacter sp.]MBK8438905.1 FAD:protein FMN transferase [Rhodobacter sp.]